MKELTEAMARFIAAYDEREDAPHCGDGYVLDERFDDAVREAREDLRRLGIE